MGILLQRMALEGHWLSSMIPNARSTVKPWHESGRAARAARARARKLGVPLGEDGQACA